MSSPQQVDILELFKKAAHEVVGKQFPQLTYDSSIAEMGIDSISSTEIIGKIEDMLEIRVSDDALMEIRTVRDLAEAVANGRPIADPPMTGEQSA